MRKSEKFLYVFLILTILGSLFLISYFSLSIIEKLHIGVFISVFVLIISLAWFIGLLISSRQRKKEKTLTNRLSMWNSITYRVKKAGETAFNKLPIGILIIGKNNEVLWSNGLAKRIFMSPLDNIELKNISKELNERLLNGQTNFNVDIYGEIYNIEYLKEHDIVYLTNITKFASLEKKYQDRTTCLGYINIDNFEEALSDFDVQERAEYNGKIIGLVAKWVEGYDAYVRALGDSRYLLIMDRSQLERMVESKFDILDDIKEIMHGNKKLRITLSIGIVCRDDNIEEVSEEAFSLLDLALNRGGDQAVVKIDNEIKFFGAKQEAIPKEEKVEIRTKSEELQDLINSSSKIFILGHTMLDADGFGASLGIYKIAKSLGKEAYIVLNRHKIDATVAKICNTIEQSYLELNNDIINPNDALSKADENSLLMIVDFQVMSQTPDDKIIKKIKNIGIIDHHRKAVDAITNHKFYYSKTYSSSSVELVLELLEFIDTKIEISAYEATWMLLGIIVDTNNFIYRTNAKTFEVASVLKKYGADMVMVQRYLKDDLSEIQIRNDFINHVERITDSIMISVSPDDTIYERSLLAKISDTMMTISGIEMGITIGNIGENVIGLSARSLGKINAQTVMEKMGGGGHLNNAAAQVKDSTLEDVVIKLKEVLKEVMIDAQKVEIVFIKDYKGKNKKYETAIFQKEIAEHLVKEGYAVYASLENMKMIENKRRASEIQKEKLIEKLTEQKEKLESKPAIIYTTTLENGIIKNSISAKTIQDAIERDFNIRVATKKLDYDNEINTLGTHIIPIYLSKDIIANLKVFVVEKEK